MRRISNIIVALMLVTMTAFGSNENTMKKENTANIGSFNTLHLGWKSKHQEEKIEGLANIISLFDIVGIQEVMKKDGVKQIVKELEKQTGEEWKYDISPYSVGSSRYREYYAFIYNAKTVKKIRKGSYYPEKERGKFFMREPYGAKFQIGDFKFTYVTIHQIYGDKKSQRQLEASQLTDVYDYFKEKYKGPNLKSGEKNDNIVIIGGDFNLPSYDDAFSGFLKHKDLIVDSIASNQKTTIGKKGLSSSYDHLFYPNNLMQHWYTGRSGVVDFTNNDHATVRKIISDHIPVFMEVRTNK